MVTIRETPEDSAVVQTAPLPVLGVAEHAATIPVVVDATRRAQAQDLA